MDLHPGRRAFLKSVSAVATAHVAAQLFSLEEAFALELDTVPPPLSPLPQPQEIRGQYLLDPRVTYLNHASIGTVPQAVHSAGLRYREICEENPWLYIWGGAWEAAREDVRIHAAGLLGCDPAEVAITHNTTEGFNVFAQGLPLAPGDEVLFSSLNHAGASVCWDHFGSSRGYAVRRFDIPLDDVPGMSLQDVVRLHEEQIREETRVLVFPHIDNIVGLRHPLSELASMAHSRGVEWVLVDGAQSAGMVPLDLSSTGIDGFSTSPHKWIQSAKGLGLLYVRKEIQETLPALWVTWGQAQWSGSARKYEDYGTRDLPEVLSLGDALAFQAALGPARKERRYQELFTRFQAVVDGSSGLRWRSPRRWEMGGILTTFQMESGSASQVSEALFQERGIVVRPFPEEGLNGLRVSPNLMNTLDELESLPGLIGRGS